MSGHGGPYMYGTWNVNINVGATKICLYKPDYKIMDSASGLYSSCMKGTLIVSTVDNICRLKPWPRFMYFLLISIDVLTHSAIRPSHDCRFITL